MIFDSCALIHFRCNEARAPAQAAPAGDASIAKVQELAALHAQGVLSDEEFAAAKAKALGI